MSSEAFFASVYQSSLPGSTLKITNFPLPPQSFFIGIPYIIIFPCAETPSNAEQGLKRYNKTLYDIIVALPYGKEALEAVDLNQGCKKQIGLWGTDNSKDTNFQIKDENFKTLSQSDYDNTIKPILDKINTGQTITPTELNTIKQYINIKGVMMYTNHGYFQYNTQLYYFSTLDNGTTLYYALELKLPFWPYSTIYNIPAIYESPDSKHTYNVYRYFTYLKHDDVNLNITPSFLLGWGSSDISGDYGADVALLTMYKSNGTQQGSTFPVTYNYTVDSNRIISGIRIISTIPSGIYYYTYDFATSRIALIVAEGFSVYPDASGNTSPQTTSNFTFITQFLQSITAANIVSGGTTTIIPDFGIGYPLNTYQITVNDDTNSTRRAQLPFQYTPPITQNTRTYTITVNGCSDTNDTSSKSIQFTVFQYVANFAVATRVIASALNYLTWTGGSLQEQFQYNSTAITRFGTTNTTFTSGNPMETSGLTAGLGYQIIPTNVNVRNPASGSYPTLYFDSVTPNTLIVSSARSQQQYTLSWRSYYIFSSPAPDGTRQYPIYVIGNGVTKTFTSLYNVVIVPFSEVTQNVPYTIKVLDITIATNVYFFDIPYDVIVTPSRINFLNTISWTAFGNQPFEVQMGQSDQTQYSFQDRSPSVQALTEDVIQSDGFVSFRPIGYTANYITGGMYHLDDNTIYVALSSTIPFFSGVFFSYDIGADLNRNDTYSLSLYRNSVVVQELEANVSNPFTWFPYNYVVTYQQGDQVYVKSNQHLNYGLSVPITFQVNASVALDQSEYTLFSTIIATMTIDATGAFTARLRGPVTIPVTFTQQGKQYTIQVKDYAIPLGNYQLDFLLVSSPTIIVTSPTFVVTSTVTVDQPEYTIISTVNATLYVGVPTTFTVQLQDVGQLFPPIALPSFTANLLSTYSFKLYGLPVNDANYVLQFTAATVLTSPVFAISTSYFSLEKPVVPTPPSRATSNSLCVTSKKNNVPTTIISIMNSIVYPKAIRGQPQFLVPCGIIPYVKELTELLKTLSLRDALIFLIQKYNIPQNTPAVTNQKRYQLPTANSKVLNPILQYTSSFRLSSKISGNSVPISTAFVQKLSDARVLTLCNDDTKTFSSSYTDMLVNATYWLSTLAPFTKDGDYTFCVVRPIQGSLKQFITASITLKDNLLIFTPVILRVVLSFYEPYGPVDFSVMFTSPLLSEILNYLSAQYEKIYINPATAL